MDTEMIREKIDLDSYADYIKMINSGKFWAEVAIRDREYENIPVKDRIIFSSARELRNHYL